MPIQLSDDNIISIINEISRRINGHNAGSIAIRGEILSPQRSIQSPYLSPPRPRKLPELPISPIRVRISCDDLNTDNWLEQLLISLDYMCRPNYYNYESCNNARNEQPNLIRIPNLIWFFEVICILVDYKRVKPLKFDYTELVRLYCRGIRTKCIESAEYLKRLATITLTFGKITPILGDSSQYSQVIADHIDITKIQEALRSTSAPKNEVLRYCTWIHWGLAMMCYGAPKTWFTFSSSPKTEAQDVLNRLWGSYFELRNNVSAKLDLTMLTGTALLNLENREPNLNYYNRCVELYKKLFILTGIEKNKKLLDALRYWLDQCIFTFPPKYIHDERTWELVRSLITNSRPVTHSWDSVNEAAVLLSIEEEHFIEAQLQIDYERVNRGLYCSPSKNEIDGLVEM